MKSTSLLVAFAAAALFAIGCGPSTPNAEHAGEHEHGEHEHGEHGEHPKMTGAVHEFHEVLAPLWHADKSPERTKKTCEAIGTFETRAADVDQDQAHVSEAEYHTAAQRLIDAVRELKKECAKPE